MDRAVRKKMTEELRVLDPFIPWRSVGVESHMVRRTEWSLGPEPVDRHPPGATALMGSIEAMIGRRRDRRKSGCSGSHEGTGSGTPRTRHLIFRVLTVVPGEDSIPYADLFDRLPG